MSRIVPSPSPWDDLLDQRVFRGPAVDGVPASLAADMIAPVYGLGGDALLSSRGQAEAVLVAAKAEAAAIMEKARAEGYAEGRAQAERVLQEAVGCVAEVAKALTTARDSIIESLAPRLADLVVRVAGRLVVGEVTSNPEWIEAIVRDALAAVRENDHVVIRLHPEDLAALETAQADLERACGAHLLLRGDRSLVRGGCVIETPRGLVDARLDSKLALIHAALVDGDAP
ncbi:MAG: FliH/SctL family protein [bacterium]